MAKTNFFVRALDDILAIIYPHVCLSCEEEAAIQDHFFCVECLFDLIPTNQYLLKENRFTDKFYGVQQIAFGAAMYAFTKSGKLQKLLHEFKYKQKPQIGYFLGRQFGKDLIKSPHLEPVDFIVPVPLHPIKERQRGFNQSEKIAKGVSDILHKPVLNKLIIRTKHQESQTAKGRVGRFNQINDSFSVVRKRGMDKKHFLIVDDVITTGATLHACLNKMKEAWPECKISMISLGIGRI